ncbi:hypothetical protein ABT186_01690 [Streptomyces sp. NPDC001634]|uniref:hypothetical protein n=1 Tax=Streptomyces sp. NPDC001634 TaxID=3154390 RepID=UPI00331FFA64
MTLTDWAIGHPAYAAVPILAAEAVALLAAWCGLWAAVYGLGQWRVRRGIRRLEHYANHPGVRAVHDQPEGDQL